MIALDFLPGKKVEVDAFPIGSNLFSCGIDFSPLFYAPVPFLASRCPPCHAVHSAPCPCPFLCRSHLAASDWSCPTVPPALWGGPVSSSTELQDLFRALKVGHIFISQKRNIWILRIFLCFIEFNSPQSLSESLFHQSTTFPGRTRQRLILEDRSCLWKQINRAGF